MVFKREFPLLIIQLIVSVTAGDGVCFIKPKLDGFSERWGKYCLDGSWAKGFQQCVEAKQGSDDDTALNEIRLYCFSKEGEVKDTVSSYDGIGCVLLGWEVYVSSTI